MELPPLEQIRASRTEMEELGLSLVSNPSPCFEIRLFYVRIAHCCVDLAPEQLCLRTLPRPIGALLEINGVRIPPSDSAALSLRRDRLDRGTSEVAYVSTDSVRITGELGLEVLDSSNDLILCGSLERVEAQWGKTETPMSEEDGRTGWSMDCYSAVASPRSASPFLRGAATTPSVELYLAGCCSGFPLILTKTIPLVSRKKVVRQGALESIPEDEEAWAQQMGSIAVLRRRALQDKGKSFRPQLCFPPAARRMDTLNDLLAASDLVSLHCALCDESVHIINADCLQHVKPGAYIVNTGSSQLIDDCALKQLLIDGTIAGCALDGAEGPQWMEAWVREMPNVLILPRSADYSEEVWWEIREKAISILQSFFLDGVVPKDAVSDEDEGAESTVADEHSEKTTRESSVLDCNSELIANENKAHSGSVQKQEYEMDDSHVECQDSALSQVADTRSDGAHGRSGKKGKKRPAHRKSHQKQCESSAMERDYNFTIQREEDTAISGREQAPSSSSRFASPDESRSRNTSTMVLAMDATPDKHAVVPTDLRQPNQLLKDDHVITLHARDQPGFHVSRQRVPGGGWFLDTMTSVTKRDPAAQFLVVLRGKDTIGLRSFAAGGKLLQINRKMEFVFASYSFDVWESWTLEGSSLDECRLINCRNPSAMLDVRIEILAAVDEEDGVARWLN